MHAKFGLALGVLVLIGTREGRAAPGLDVDPPPSFSVVLDGHVGMGVTTAGPSIGATGIAGGSLRLRLSYAQLGVLAEAEQFPVEDSRHVAGVAGAHVPFHGWIDLDVFGGIGRRTHSSDDRRYGSDGYRVVTPTAMLRVGISDRHGGLLGGRVGAALDLSADLKSEEVPWTYGRDSPDGGVSGVSLIGGFRVGMLLSMSLDLAVE
jgi:hypothetical protein